MINFFYESYTGKGQEKTWKPNCGKAQFKDLFFESMF